MSILLLIPMENKCFLRVMAREEKWKRSYALDGRHGGQLLSQVIKTKPV